MHRTIHETWQALTECVDAGLVKGLGVCNMKVSLLHELLKGTDYVPQIAQSERHPYCQQKGLIQMCEMNGIQFQAYSPLGYGEFKAEGELTVLESPEIHTIAAKHGKSAAEVVLRWHIQGGIPTPPFSLKESEIRQNLTVGSWAMDDADMALIASIDKNYHYLRPEAWYGLPLWD
jgi:diketogulonate reductase-like aldo/keto reductase